MYRFGCAPVAPAGLGKSTGARGVIHARYSERQRRRRGTRAGCARRQTADIVDTIPGEGFIVDDKVDQVHRLVASDGRYRREAYFFTLDALNVAQRARALTGEVGHITGQELCASIREHAENEFGFLAKAVFRQWGVGSTDDFGEIVFAMVEHGIIGKQDSDTKDDFAAIYRFEDVFEKQYIAIA
jgi:uncharacterized repeat protein (TIGR04138 family)